MKNKQVQDYDRRRKMLTVISLLVVLVLAALATVFVWRWLSSFSEEGFREYIQSFGVWGWLVFLALQFLQVFIALIPGELLETAAGYAFDPIVGTILCFVGVALASALVFVLTKRLGVRMVEVFISREKINELRFINTEKKRNRLVFLLFFIPGTPKDLLTYFVGLTDMKLGKFLAISMIARIPSVVSSTIGGSMLGSGEYTGAIILYAIVGGVSLGGMLAYNMFVRRKKDEKRA